MTETEISFLLKVGVDTKMGARLANCIFRQVFGCAEDYRVQATIDVDGVISAYALESYNTSFVIVLEDIGGESLTNLLTNRRLELPEFLRLAIRVTDILGEIHQQGIIHKDINPSNIIWNPATGRREPVPRHTEVPDLLARKICRAPGNPEP